MTATQDGDPPHDAWGAVAPLYGLQEPLQRRSVDVLLDKLAPLPSERVLDVGSGTGYLPRRLVDRHHHKVAALERSSGMLAAGHYAGAPPVQADAVRLPVADACVEVVSAGWVLHVLSPADRAAAVSEAARVLKRGGRLGLVVPAAPRTGLQRLLRAVARRAARTTGLRAFEVPTDLPALLADSGLQVRHHTRTGRGYLADVVICTRAAVPVGDT